MYEVIWGNGNTGVAAGVVSTHDTREEAEAARDAFLSRHADNPDVGCWIEAVYGTRR